MSPVIPWYIVTPAPRKKIPTPLISEYTYRALDQPYLKNEFDMCQNGIRK